MKKKLALTLIALMIFSACAYAAINTFNAFAPDEFEQLTLGSLRKAVQEGNLEEGSFLCGAIAGMIKEVKPAKEIIEEMFAQADKLLG